MKITASDRHLQHETDEKEVALCLYTCYTSFSSTSSGLKVFSTIPPFCQQHYSTKFEFSVRHFWANFSLCEGNWREKEDIPAFQMLFVGSKAEPGEPVYLENSDQQKALCPRGRVAAQSLKGKGGAEALWLSSQVWWWMSHCSPIPTSSGWVEGKEWKSVLLHFPVL